MKSRKFKKVLKWLAVIIVGLVAFKIIKSKMPKDQETEEGSNIDKMLDNDETTGDLTDKLIDKGSDKLKDLIDSKLG